MLSEYTPPLSVPSARKSPNGPSAVDVTPLCNTTGPSETYDSVLGLLGLHHCYEALSTDMAADLALNGTAHAAIQQLGLQIDPSGFQRPSISAWR